VERSAGISASVSEKIKVVKSNNGYCTLTVHLLDIPAELDIICASFTFFHEKA
jgi:hypothetical protein